MILYLYALCVCVCVWEGGLYQFQLFVMDFYKV